MLSYTDALKIARKEAGNKRILSCFLFENEIFFLTSALKKLKRVDLTASYIIVDLKTGKFRRSNYAIESREMRDTKGKDVSAAFSNAIKKSTLVDMTQQELDDLQKLPPASIYDFFK